MQEKLIYYWLAISKVSPYKVNKLLDIYSAFELYDIALKEERIEKLVGEESYSKLIKYHDIEFLTECIYKLEQKGIKVIARCDDEFPDSLKQLEVNPPIILYCSGDLSLLKTTCVSIVGTRHCSRYGKEVTQKFATELCKYNFTIVSGLATGIDAYAHQSVIENNGKAIAVLGNGLSKFSPLSNYNLFEKVKEQGLVITEYEPSFTGSKYSFPERNRLIAGLSEVCIVTEAGMKSGSAITADRANEQGKTVFAVPGNITSPKSIGANTLIKEGASILTSTQDILEYFDIKQTKINKNCIGLSLDFYEEKLYNLLQTEEMSFDELKEKSGFSVTELSSILLSLEIKDLIKRTLSNFYVRNGEL